MENNAMSSFPLFLRLLLTVGVCRCAWGVESSYGTGFTLVFPEMNASTYTYPYAVYVAGVDIGGARHVAIQSQLSAPQLSHNVSLSLGQAHLEDIHGGFLTTGSMGGSSAVSLTSEIDDVAVYVIPRAPGDAYTAFPNSALGREYYCVTFCPHLNTQCQINIVAPASSASVTVNVFLPHDLSGSVTYDGTSYTAGSTISKTLVAFQSMQIRSHADLTGTRVVSSLDVSVLAGAVTTHVGRDTAAVNSLVEQMPPVTSWGRDVVAVSAPPVDGGNFFRILACQVETTVRITGEASFILDQGQWVQRNLEDGPRFVWASKPILVVRLTAGQALTPVKSPSMLVLAPVEQFPNRSVVLPSADPSALQTLSFVVEDRFKHNLYINGTKITTLTSWINVNNTNYAVAHVQLSQSNNYVTSNDPDTRFMVYVFRGSMGQAFFGAMNFNLLNPPCTVTTALPGDHVDNDCDGRIDEDAVCTGASPDCDFPSSPESRDLLGTRFLMVLPDFLWDNLTHFSVMMASNSTSPVTVDYVSIEGSGSVSVDATLGYRLQLPTTLMNTVTSRTNKTVIFTSTSDVSIYVEGRQKYGNRHYAAARLIPLDGLGTEYFAVCLCQKFSCQLSVIAAFPQTVVRIRLRFSNTSATLQYDGKDYGDKDLLVETLAQYEALHLRMETVDMTGSHVTSDKPIAVFGAGASTTNTAPSMRSTVKPDSVWEQLIPVQALELEYVTYNAPDRTSSECPILREKCRDSIRIVATEESTEVSYTDNGTLWLRHAGDYWDLDRQQSPSLSFWLRASQPVMVAQLPAGDFKTSPALQLVPPIVQFASSDVIRVEDFDGDQDSLMLLANAYALTALNHRNKTNMVWSPGEKLFYAAQLRISDTVAYAIDTGTANQTFWGFLYSAKIDVSPGTLMLPLNFRLENLNLRCRLTPMTFGDNKDNDCDGRIDEEICDNDDPDDDYDGMENEDCQVFTASSSLESTSTVMSSLESSFVMTSSLEPTSSLESSIVLTSSLEPTSTVISSLESSIVMTSSLEPIVTSSTMPYTSSVGVSSTDLVAPSASASSLSSDFTLSAFTSSTAIPTSSYLVVPTSLSASQVASLITSQESITDQVTFSDLVASSTSAFSLSSDIPLSAFASSAATLTSSNLDAVSTILSTLHLASFITSQASSTGATSSSDPFSTDVASASPVLSSVSVTADPSSNAALTSELISLVTEISSAPHASQSFSEGTTIVSIGSTLSGVISSSSSATAASSTWTNVQASLTTATTGSIATSTPKLSTNAIAVVTSATPSPSSALSSLCSCGCVWHTSSLENAPISQVVQSIVKELTVDRSSMSATRRSKESAPDERTSAKTMGYFGVAIICAVFAGILILDAGSLIRDAKQLAVNIRDCFRRK